jgi:hypothetical protein
MRCTPYILSLLGATHGPKHNSSSARLPTCRRNVYDCYRKVSQQTWPILLLLLLLFCMLLLCM